MIEPIDTNAETPLTINESVAQLQHALRDYIEATYHVSDLQMVAQRKALLNEEGVIYQRPYIESTPRYATGPPFAEIPGLHPTVGAFFTRLSERTDAQKPLLFNPPYTHQGDAISETLVGGRSLIVMTGTGSGKTESFLMPILGKLAIEASTKPKAFEEQRAVRALILYPMNALVNDQLGRLRLLFGDNRVGAQFREWSGRPLRFARYTSRTLYPGVRTSKKDGVRLAPIDKYYVEHLRRAGLRSLKPKPIPSGWSRNYRAAANGRPSPIWSSGTESPVRDGSTRSHSVSRGAWPSQEIRSCGPVMKFTMLHQMSWLRTIQCLSTC